MIQQGRPFSLVIKILHIDLYILYNLYIKNRLNDIDGDQPTFIDAVKYPQIRELAKLIGLAGDRKR